MVIDYGKTLERLCAEALVGAGIKLHTLTSAAVVMAQSLAADDEHDIASGLAKMRSENPSAFRQNPRR